MLWTEKLNDAQIALLTNSMGILAGVLGNVVMEVGDERINGKRDHPVLKKTRGKS
ncbi:MAG: hypothetical protein PXX77_10860 [Gallionella sp.]|nr:hypothetical protein [Gallionella sp.]